MRISKIILKSQDKERLGQFLSQLFEMELDHRDSTVTLRSESGINFDLEDLLEPIIEGNTVIDLRFDNASDLHDLMQKIRFLEYRGDFAHVPTSDLISLEGHHYFEFSDLDQRIWRLSAES